MKIILATVSLIFALSVAAQTEEKEKQGKQEKQEQQQTSGVDNNFMTGPYNPKGEYIFFDRAEREKREADEELSEEEM